MALLERNHQPTSRDLRIFGGILFVFGVLVAGVVFFATGSETAATVIIVVSLLLTAVYFAVLPVRPLLFAGWMALFFPLAWLISHTLLAITYYGVITPIGLVLRVTGYDPLKRKLSPTRASYWTQHTTDHEARRYFQQF